MSTDQEANNNHAANEIETKKSPKIAQTKAKRDPVRTITIVLIAVCLFLFIWHVASDRMAPWTDHARVQGFIIPITPKVSGKVKKIHVTQDQMVLGSGLMIEIETDKYELAVHKAKSQLELANQDVGANTEAVVAAQANVANAKASVNYARKEAQRYKTLAKDGVISQSKSDQITAEAGKAEAQFANAKASLEKTKKQLGKEGQDNAGFQAALSAMKLAQKDLADTKIYAPSLGWIANLKIDEGHYAKAGVPLMTFISGDDVWVTAYLRENSITNLKVGNKVDVALDVKPGAIFPGEVTSIGGAIKQASGGGIGDLEFIKDDGKWLRNAQRFPVIIRFTDDSVTGYRRHGGQADVQIYTDENNTILNSLGWLWIRFLSILSYVY